MRHKFDKARGFVKSLQDMGVHAGSPSQVIESLKRENSDLRKRLKKCQTQLDELLDPCEGVIARVESRLDECGEKCPLCGEWDHSDGCSYLAVLQAITKYNDD